MADIVFLPVCSNCGNILLNDIIDYREEENLTEFRREPVIIHQKTIMPSQCRYCNAGFETINMPTTLPFGI